MGSACLGAWLQQADDGGVELALARQTELELLQFGAGGQASEPEQVAALLEVGVGGELVDVDAAIGEHALVAIDVANARISCGDAFQAFRRISNGHTFLGIDRISTGYFRF